MTLARSVSEGRGPKNCFRIDTSPTRERGTFPRSRVGLPEIRSRSPQGHTLLEVVLALAISTVLMASLWMAVDIQLRVTDSGRAHVEQAQLARAILRRMSDDLRSAVRYEPIDMSGLMAMPSTSDLTAALTADPTSAASAADAASSAGAGAAVPTSASTATDPAESTESESVAASVVPPSVPGLYGDRFGLQVDVSRLPRIDQYEAWNSDADAILRDRVSDVKTVAFYVQPPDRTAVGGGAQGGGLFRRELGRAVTTWAADNGNIEGLEQQGELLAPEVVALEFRYFDGTVWLDSWDSSVRNGLPVAVEIALAIAASESRAVEPPTRTLSLAERAADSAGKILIYRLLVHLPAARPTTLEESAVDPATTPAP